MPKHKKDFEWKQVREFSASQIVRRCLINPSIDEPKLINALKILSIKKKFKKWLKSKKLK